MSFLWHILIIKYFNILGLITYRTKLQFVSLLWTEEFGQSTSLLYMQLKEKIESQVYTITNLRQEKTISHYPLLDTHGLVVSIKCWYRSFLQALSLGLLMDRQLIHCTWSTVQLYTHAINTVAGNVHNLVITQSEHKILLFSTYCFFFFLDPGNFQKGRNICVWICWRVQVVGTPFQLYLSRIQGKAV